MMIEAIGWIGGLGESSLARARAKIADILAELSPDEAACCRSYIRRDGDGYAWGVVLRE